MREIQSLIKQIAKHNNIYRDLNSSHKDKIKAMWNIGDVLVRNGVTSPHSAGWKVQKETNGLIKRPTIFRSHKLRTIWPSITDLLSDIGAIKGLSNLTDMLPLIDPAQGVREKLPQEVLHEIFKCSCKYEPKRFKQYVKSLKSKYAHDRLGQSLDRAKHLGEMSSLLRAYRTLLKQLEVAMADESIEGRNKIRGAIPDQEFKSMANMCLSLTTKDNIRLYKKLEPNQSNASDESFKYVYGEFRILLSKKSDIERARLRRLIYANDLAKMSDQLSSIMTEDGVVDYRERKKISFNL